MFYAFIVLWYHHHWSLSRHATHKAVLWCALHLIFNVITPCSIIMAMLLLTKLATSIMPSSTGCVQSTVNFNCVFFFCCFFFCNKNKQTIKVSQEMSPGGDSHIKAMGMIIGNFEKNPYSTCTTTVLWTALALCSDCYLQLLWLVRCQKNWFYGSHHTACKENKLLSAGKISAGFAPKLLSKRL